MNVARTRFALWTSGAACLGGTAGLLALAGVVALDTGDAGTQGVVRSASTTQPAPAALPPLSDFEPAWAHPLRRPLVDPPPAVATVAQGDKPANLLLRLVGTIVDGSHPRGVFLVGLSSVELRGVGERAGGAEVLRVDENSATVSYAGQTIVLKREKDPFNTLTPTEAPSASSRAAPAEGQ